MSFDWSQYLTIAEQSSEAAEQESNPSVREAHFRCSISRAYYSAFNLAFKGLGWRKPDGGASIHQWVIDRYENVVTEDAAKKLAYSEIATKLNRLRALRVKADYHDDFDADLVRQTSNALRFSQRIAARVAEGK